MAQRLQNSAPMVTGRPFQTEGVSLYATIGDRVQYRNVRLFGQRRRRRGRRRRKGGFIKGANSTFDIATGVDKTTRRTFSASPVSSFTDWPIPTAFASQTVTFDVRRCEADVENENDNSRIVTLQFDANRDVVTEIRGTATLLEQEVRAGGIVRLRLAYAVAGGTQPDTFRATATAGPSSPASQTATYSGQRIIEIDTPPLLDTSAYTYKITAENGATTKDLITAIVVNADASGPPAATFLTTEAR